MTRILLASAWLYGALASAAGRAGRHLSVQPLPFEPGPVDAAVQACALEDEAVGFGGAHNAGPHTWSSLLCSRPVPPPEPDLLCWDGRAGCILSHYYTAREPAAMHDHVGWTASLVLSGTLREEWVPDGALEADGSPIVSEHPVGTVVLRPPLVAHRLAPVGDSARTLFVLGAPERRWGWWEAGIFRPVDPSTFRVYVGGGVRTGLLGTPLAETGAGGALPSA